MKNSEKYRSGTTEGEAARLTKQIPSILCCSQKRKKLWVDYVVVWSERSPTLKCAAWGGAVKIIGQRFLTTNHVWQTRLLAMFGEIFKRFACLALPLLSHQNDWTSHTYIVVDIQHLWIQLTPPSCVYAGKIKYFVNRWGFSSLTQKNNKSSLFSHTKHSPTSTVLGGRSKMLI